MSHLPVTLDMKIMEALHIDGRASWNRIADVLGANERTIARRGHALLESGVVRVVAVGIPALGYVVGLRCGHGQARMTSRALSQHEISHWTHVTAGDFDVVAEVTPEPRQEMSALLEDIPAVAGIRDTRVYPILEYLRLAGWWDLGILSPRERRAMRSSTVLNTQQHISTTESLPDRDHALLYALKHDGRLSYEELGRRSGTSDATAKRRLEALRRDGIINIRAIIDPDALGFGTETITWLDVPPRHLPVVTEGIRNSAHIKYASRIAGPWDFILKNHVQDRTAIDVTLPDEPWVDHVNRMNVSVVLRTDKRSMLPTLTS